MDSHETHIDSTNKTKWECVYFFYFKISDIKPVTGQGLKGGASNCDYILRQGGGDRNTSRIRGQQFDEFLCFRHG